MIDYWRYPLFLQGVAKKSRRLCSRQGFTLLELLIAMSLLALIVAITMGAMRLASRSVAGGGRKMENQERLRTAVAVLDAQIQSQLPLAYGTEGNRVNYFRGDAKSLKLMTGYSLWGGREGYILVNYRVEADGGGRETLYVSEQTPKIEGNREAKLFTEASAMSFEYFNRDPDDKEGKWSEQWNDENNTPSEVRLNVSYGKKKYAFQFPVRSRGEAPPTAFMPVSLIAGQKK
jgi:general secretion pathway protein J